MTSSRELECGGRPLGVCAAHGRSLPLCTRRARAFSGLLFRPLPPPSSLDQEGAPARRTEVRLRAASVPVQAPTEREQVIPRCALAVSSSAACPARLLCGDRCTAPPVWPRADRSAVAPRNVRAGAGRRRGRSACAQGHCEVPRRQGRPRRASGHRVSSNTPQGSAVAGP